MVNNGKNKITNPFDGVSDEKLMTDLNLAQTTGDWEKAMRVTEEMKNRKAPTKASDYTEDFNKTFEDLKKRMKSKDVTKHPTPDELKKFFKKEVQNFASNAKTERDSLEKSKDDEIARLQGQLNDALLDVPGFTEQFSLKRRRLVKITKKLDAFEKEDKVNYPKNFLIYAMAITENKRRGAGQGLKRSRVKLRWNKKSHNIKDEIKNLEDKLLPDANDSNHKKMIKSLLKEKVQKAKLAYIEDVKRSVGV